MAIDLITHGAGEALFYTLNSMAMMFQGGKTSMIGGLMILAGMIASTAMVAKLVGSFNLAIPMNWFMTYMIILTSIAIPKTDVIIIDRITGFRSPVANVPYLFALPAGYFSQIGDWLARKSDDVFSVPSGHIGDAPQSLAESLTYSKSGVAMTTKLVAAASHADFMSNNTFNNFREYVSECVVYDIALGKYSVDHMLAQENMWEFIKSKASPHGGVVYGEKQADGSVRNDFLTCEEAAAKLDAVWNKEIQDATFVIGKTLYPNSRTPSTILKQNLVSAYGYLAGVSKSADEIMQQNIMRNAVEAGFLTRAKQYGSVESIHGYSIEKAQAMQEANYAIQGGMAEKSVAMLKIVVEILFYGMFPFVAVVAVLPGATGIIKTYLVGLMWLQSWAPMYSLINMIVNVYAKSKVSSIAGAGLLTASSIPDLGNASASVSKYAGYAMMTVPFLSWGIFKYGGGALAQMSAHFGAPTQGAAGGTASEAVTGNISQGNTSFDTSTRSVASFYKHDDNASVATGAFRGQNLDGSISTNYAANDTLDRTAAISRIGAQVFSGEQYTNQLNKMANTSFQKAESLSSQATDSFSEAMSSFANMQDTKSIDKAVQSITGLDESSALSRSISDSLGHQISDSKNLNNSFGGKVEGSIGGGLPFGASIKGSVSAARNVSANYSDQKANSYNIGDTSSEAIREYGSLSTQQKEALTSVLGTGFRANMDNAYSKSLSASASEQEALNYQRSASHVSSQSAGHSVDLSQDIMGYARSHGFSDSDVSSIMSNEQKREEFMGVFFKEKYASIESGFSSNKSDIESSYNPSSHNVVNNASDLSQAVFDAAGSAASQEISDKHIHESRNSLTERHAEFSQEVISKTNEHNKGYNPFWANDKRTSDKE